MTKSVVAALGAAGCALLLALPMAAAGPAATKSAARTVWAPENLTGSIQMVDPAKNLVVVKGPDGVPFDMVVTASTRIEANGQRMTLNQLSNDDGQNVSVRFVPERSGDIARTIRIGG